MLGGREEAACQGRFYYLNRRLEEGDRVLLLRVQHGQKFIVLSRIFEEEA